MIASFGFNLLCLLEYKTLLQMDCLHFHQLKIKVLFCFTLWGVTVTIQAQFIKTKGSKVVSNNMFFFRVSVVHYQLLNTYSITEVNTRKISCHFSFSYNWFHNSCNKRKWNKRLSLDRTNVHSLATTEHKSSELRVWKADCSTYCIPYF